MPVIKERYKFGDLIQYKTSVPLKDRGIIPEGQILDQIYVVQPKGKNTDGQSEALVKAAYPADQIFDYEEEVPSGHQIIQALRNTKNNKLTFRLLTGIGAVYGRIVFNFDQHTKVLNVRSLAQFSKYQEAAELINATSPGPHRLESKVENGDSTLYTFKRFDGRIRKIEFIKEIAKK